MRINLDKKKKEGNFYILTWRREIKEEEEKKNHWSPSIALLCIWATPIEKS
jgi:hypothetical protein